METKDIVKEILTDILTAVYQPFWFSLALTVCVMAIYLLALKNTNKRLAVWKILKTEGSAFLKDSQFRKVSFLVFASTLILFRTLFSRELWIYPLSDVLGSWSFYAYDGTFTSEPLENCFLFFPFALLLLWCAKDRLGKHPYLKTIQVVFLFSLTIETAQLLFRLGTFQISDLFYNTLGGALGSFLYFLFAGRKETKPEELPIPLEIDFSRFTDARGNVSIPFDLKTEEKLSFRVRQVNEGTSEKANTMHGMHFQKEPFAQAKLVYVSEGSIYNVAVDVRKNSKTFGTYYASTLSANDAKAIYIPKGFAHGYLSLKDHTRITWLVDEDYHKEAAMVLSYKDPNVNIPWPVKPEEMMVSEKDAQGLSLEEAKAL